MNSRAYACVGSTEASYVSEALHTGVYRPYNQSFSMSDDGIHASGRIFRRFHEAVPPLQHGGRGTMRRRLERQLSFPWAAWVCCAAMGPITESNGVRCESPPAKAGGQYMESGRSGDTLVHFEGELAGPHGRPQPGRGAS